MRNLPTSADAKGRSLTIADFIEAGGRELAVEVVAGGSNLSRRILEPALNRPGLALTGFYENFAFRRIQLLGNPEISYVASLPDDIRLARFRALIERGANCFVYTNGRRPWDSAARAAEECGAVVLVTSLDTRRFSHLAAFVLENLSAPRTSLYGTMIEVSGVGVLFEGDPGLGKSETALGLIKRGCALVADDLTCIRREFGSDRLYGSASDSTAGFMEIRGIGIINVPAIFGVNSVRGEKRLELVVTFKLMNDVRGEIDRIGQTRRYRNILGVDVPNVIIPVSEGRDLVNLVETAAQQQKLLMTGYDPVGMLSERLRSRVDEHIVRTPESPAQ